MALAPIFGDGSFPSIGAADFLVPRIGVGSGTPLIRWPSRPNDPVDLRMSDGVTVRVFENLVTALRCLELMRTRSQAYLAANDDVSIYAIGFTKLLVCENTLQNQRLMSSYAPTYDAGKTRFVHRSLSSVVNLQDALQSVGAVVRGPLQRNDDLRAEGLHMVLVDWNYDADASALTSPGSVLDNTSATQILYSWDPPLTTGVRIVT